MRKWLWIIVLFSSYRICSAQQWEQIPFPTSAGLYDCSFINKDTGWVLGSIYPDKYIYKTNDGGVSWVIQNYPPDPQHNMRLFMSIHFIDANVGIIGCGNYLNAGADADSVSTILWTYNGGLLWGVQGFRKCE